MPELKNSFVKGRMNLDLDERLIPNGEYREATNIQVSTSEGSDIGSVQNILGNTVVNGQSFSVTGVLECIGSISDEKNNRLFWFVVDVVDDGSGNFSNQMSAIIEYDVDAQLVTPVVVDTDNSRLEFNYENYITGINIVDDLLFFTDGVTEPKKINIKTFKNNNHTDLATTSNLFVNDVNTNTFFTKQNITVIKQKPKHPPVVDIVTQTNIFLGSDENVPTMQAYDFTGVQEDDTIIVYFDLVNYTVVGANENAAIDGNPALDSNDEYTDITGYTWSWPTSGGSNSYTYDINDAYPVNFSQNDILLMSDEGEPGVLPNNAQLRATVSSITYQGGGVDMNNNLVPIIARVELEVLTINNSLGTGDLVLDYMIEDTIDDIFNKDFARFAYRYKYQDGEYSAFSPFTQPVFSTTRFSISPTTEPYNTGMENNIKQIILTDFVSYDIPLDVVEIDLLYKSDLSSVVYSIDTVKKLKPNGTISKYWNTINGSNKNLNLPVTQGVAASNTGYYSITKDIIYAALPKNQLLRPYDNVPKKAKSQDFTAGRIIYGNYTQNVNVSNTNTGGMVLNYEKRQFHTGMGLADVRGSKSVKSQRTYQAGIVYLDEQGRETPVFTSGDSSSKKIDYVSSSGELNASNSHRLVAQSIPTVGVPLSVAVTGVEHSSGSQNDGRYFFFELDEMTSLIPGFDSTSATNNTDHVIKAYRNNALIYQGTVRLFNQTSANSGTASPSGGSTKGHGRIHPFSNSAAGDWQEGDIITTIEAEEASDINEAAYFKLFVKETSGEYYNLVLDRVYRAEEDGNLWLSFPSSDRNKIKEEDFIILKKSIDLDTQVSLANKFKVIDIQNEAPEFIRVKYKQLGVLDGNGNLTGANGLYTEAGNQPAEGVTQIVMNKQSFEDESVTDIQKVFDNKESGLSIQFKKTLSNANVLHSKRYNIVSVDTITTSTDNYLVVIDEPIVARDAWVEDSVGTLTPTLKTVVSVEETKQYEEFQGRFFVKIISNIVTREHLEPQINATGQSIISARAELFALLDGGSSSQFKLHTAHDYPSSGLLASHTPNTGVISDTQGEWQDALKFGGNEVKSGWFIDGMHFTHHQPTISTDVSATSILTDPNEGGDGAGVATTPGSNGLTFDVSVSGNLTKSYIQDYSNTDINWVHNDSAGEGGYLSGSDENKKVWQNMGSWYNGFEGVIQASGVFNGYTSSAAKAWKSQLGTFGTFKEEVYGEEGSSGFYMHLAFGAPGVDLHDGTGLNVNGSDPTTWYTSGGGNAATDATTLSSNGISARINLQAIDNFNCQTKEINKVCNIRQNSTTNIIATTHQWDPIGHTALGNFSQANKDLLDNLQVGNKFTFANDESNTVFTILRVTEKRVYNHTAWNKRAVWKHANEEWDEDQNSVHYHWHKYVNLAIAGNSDAEDYFDNELSDAIKRFGAADNRRVVYIIELDKNPDDLVNSPESLGGPSSTVESDFIQFQEEYNAENSAVLSDNPAVFETESREDIDLDIYYEASQVYPTRLDSSGANADNSKGYLIAPIGTKVRCTNYLLNYESDGQTYVECKVKSWDGNIVELDKGFLAQGSGTDITDLDYQTGEFVGSALQFHKEDTSYVQLAIASVEQITAISGTSYVTKIKLQRNVRKVALPYYNCFSFGNGVESNRIRDDFNQPFIKNGVKASTILQEQYNEDERTSGLIYSGIYNKNTSLNNLNQFIAAEKITKELEPTYGSIQKLFARDSDLIALCEDKIVQIVADKDVIFNADGNPQLTASNKVLGQSRPFVGEYGISKNPESFASSLYRAYFTDKQRGAVMRLSMDGLTPISNAGMKDWFRDEFKNSHVRILGSYDTNKGHYNVTFDNGGTPAQGAKTVSWKENVKGWVSFKSFIPEAALSCVNTYFSIKAGELWSHDNQTRNSFYNTPYSSEVTTIFNDAPNSVKTFRTLNYDGEAGWTVRAIATNLNQGTVPNQFINKEGRWYTDIKSTSLIPGTSNLDLTLNSLQGIGFAESIDYNIP